MQTHPHSKWWLRIVTFSLAALAASNATYWVMKTRAAPPLSAPTAMVFPTPSAPDPARVAKLLGGGKTPIDGPASAPDAVSRRFSLTGVLAQGDGGYAVISIDGKAARAYRVGKFVNDLLVLKSVSRRSAVLATGPDAPPSFTLELPALAPSGSGGNPSSVKPSANQSVTPPATDE